MFSESEISVIRCKSVVCVCKIKIRFCAFCYCCTYSLLLHILVLNIYQQQSVERLPYCMYFKSLIGGSLSLTETHSIKNEIGV